ncbi:hypothetical protein LUZ63_013032 [Rhynchospora breviuscula]|uniref:Protein kinase domain-containing protein n=1 Tax=Rhynchospora breviuscula TaxID=2022672 RepID=A0A9Q0C7S6_9POAL|nr:hypothetical protein LUZ63_013032 [Rhynchospora breviuscula]
MSILCGHFVFNDAVTPPAAEGTASKTDISALLSFKSQISGDPFGVLSSWNESFHHCQWQGVLCGRHHPDRVTALVLDSRQLTGDFGLARFLESPDSVLSQSLTSTGGIKGSIGYIPPEYGMGGRPSVEGDVYSYGILLLEIFTGVSPTDERLKDGVSLHKHVEMAFPEQVMGIVDTKLFSAADVEANTYASENVFDCILTVIQCGLLCSKELPKERITIKDVVKQLNATLKKLLTP